MWQPPGSPRLCKEQPPAAGSLQVCLAAELQMLLPSAPCRLVVWAMVGTPRTMIEKKNCIVYSDRNPQANQNYNQSLATTPLCASHVSPRHSWGHSAVVLCVSFRFLARSFETVLFPGSAMLFLMAIQVIHGLLPGE